MSLKDTGVRDARQQDKIVALKTLDVDRHAES
jgi:hypothetical protein